MPTNDQATPNVTPAYTFQNPGIGAVIQQGVAGLLHAIQSKKQLDQADEEIKQRQQEFELQQAQSKQNALLSQEQIAQMQFNRKERLNEFKSQRELVGKQREGLAAYNRWVGSGGDLKELAKTSATISDPDVQEFFHHKVMENLQLRAAKMQLEPQPREVTPSYQAIGMSPEGQPLILNARTGRVSTGDATMAPRTGVATEGERRNAGLLSVAQQGLDAVTTQINNGYSPLQESGAQKTARFFGMDRTARYLSSDKGKLFYNGVLRVYSNFLYAVSGAQVGDKEITRQAEQQTVDFLDSPTTLQQKMEFLRGSVAAMRILAGRAAPGDERAITPATIQYANDVKAWNDGGRQGEMPRPSMEMTPTPHQSLQHIQQNDPESWSSFMQATQQMQDANRSRF